MSLCHEMTAGEIYVCKSCGLEMQVLSSCAETGACSCTDSVSCCGQPMTLKA